jgi:hypothetical protein
MNHVEALARRLQAITDGKGNHMKYWPEEQCIQWAKILLIKRYFNLNIQVV